MSRRQRLLRIIAVVTVVLSVVTSTALALAVNAASDDDAWPWKLEAIRDHPWRAILILVGVSILLAWILWMASTSESGADPPRANSSRAEGPSAMSMSGNVEGSAVNTGQGSTVVNLSNVTAEAINVSTAPLKEEAKKRTSIPQIEISLARTRRRLRGIGLTDKQIDRAFEILDNRPIPSAIASLKSGQLLVLVGELGSGKSEIAESWLRASARAESTGNPLAPIPVWISAREIKGNIFEEVMNRSQHAEELDLRGFDLVIDELDALTDPRRISAILDDAATFAQAHGKVRVVATVRPGYSVPDVERMDAPKLTQEEAIEIVRALADEGLHLRYDIPPSLLEVIRTPLYALLAGHHLANLPRPFTRASLLQLTAEEAVAIAQRKTGLPGTGSTGWAFRRAAVAAIGGRPLRATDLPEADLLLESRLVIDGNSGIVFPIPIIEQYFAGQAILRREIEIDLSSPVSLTRWRYPLALALVVGEPDEVMVLMEDVTRHNPAIASWLIDESIATTTGQRNSTESLDSGIESPILGEVEATARALAAGRRIRRATQAWVTGLGDLGVEAGPTDGQGALRPLGVFSHGEGLFEAIWAPGGRQLPELFPLFGEDAPPNHGYQSMFHAPPNWGPGRAGQLPGSSHWEWRWSRESISGQIGEILKQRRLMVRPGSFLEREHLWTLAQALMNRRIGTAAISPEAITQIAGDLVEELKGAPERPYFTVNNRLWFRPQDLHRLITLCDELRQMGTALQRPVPGEDDRDNRGGWVWSGYTPRRMLEVAEAVWREGYKGYGELVSDHFTSSGRVLRRMALGRIKVRGLLAFEGEGYEGQPVLAYTVSSVSEDEDLDRMEQVRRGQKVPEPDVKFRLGSKEEASGFGMGPRHGSVRRPAGVIGSAYGIPHGGMRLLDVYGSRPATDLAYELLNDDLAGFGLVRSGVARN